MDNGVFVYERDTMPLTLLEPLTLHRLPIIHGNVQAAIRFVSPAQDKEILDEDYFEEDGRICSF